MLHAHNFCAPHYKMIFENNAKASGLLGKKPGIADVSVAWTGTARWMIVGQDQAPGVEVQGSPKDLSRRDRQQAFEPICENLVAYNEAFEVCEHANQSFLGQPPQRPVKMSYKSFSAGADVCSQEFLSDSVVEQLSDDHESLEPVGIICADLAQFILRGACYACDGAKVVEQLPRKLVRLVVERGQKRTQISFTVLVELR